MKVEGVITNDAGQPIGFFVDGDDGTFHQWGQTTEVLGANVDMMERLRDAVWESTSERMGDTNGSTH